MKAKLFLKNTVILTVSSIVLRLIAVFFGAYLSRKIGTEGMGLFQLIFSVYNFASTLATSGIYLTVTRLVAEAMGKNSYPDANDAVKKCIIYGGIVSIIASVALFYFSEPIAINLLEDRRSILSLKTLSVALPFMAFSATLRGYFFALRKVIKSSSSQIFEQLVRMVTVSMALTILLPKGMTYACMAIALGSVIGEALAFLYTLFFYMKDKNSRFFIPKSRRENTKKVLRITVPIALSSYLRSALVTVENILIPKGFKRYGATAKSALAQYGMMEAMVMPILTFPSAFLASFSNLLIPELAEAMAIGNKRRINRLSATVLELTLLFSYPITASFIAFGKDLGIAIYNNAEAGISLQVLAPLVPLIYLDIVADAMLKGLDKQVNSLRYSIIDSGISIILIYLLIPIYGVNGYISVIFISTFVNTALSVNCLISVTEIPFSIKNTVIKPMLSSSASAFFVSFIFKSVNFSSGLKVTLQMFLMLLIYFLLLKLTNSINSKEMKFMKSLISPKRKNLST